MANDRDIFIQKAIEFKLNPSQIDNALSDAGLPKLNKTETLKIQDGTFGKGLLPTMGNELKQIGGGLVTLLGGAGQYLSNPEFANQVNQNVGNYIQDKGIGGASLDFINTIMSPYNDLTVDKVFTQPIGETFTDITAGIQARPLNATLDTLGNIGIGVEALKSTKTGAKLLDQAGKTISKAVENSKAPDVVKSLFTGTKEHQINSILNTSKIAPNATIEKLDNLNFTIKSATPEDLSIAIKNLEEGTRTGTQTQLELTEQLKNLSKGIDDIMVQRGLDPGQSRQNAKAQYITRQLQKEGKDIPVLEVKEYLDNPEHIINNTNKERLAQLANEAEIAYDSGLIYPVRHATDATMAREGLISEAVKKKRGREEKLYGTQSYEDLANSLKQTGYSDKINRVSKSEQTLGAIDEINNTLGRKVDDLSNLKLAENEVVISPRLLREKLGTSIVQGGNLDNDIKSLSRGLNKAEMERYADDLYIYTKQDLKALEKAYTTSKETTIIPKLTNDLTSLAKKAALATPRYIAGNLTANVGMNLTAGVTPLHYALAVMYRDEIPKALKASTTFSGYLGKESRVNTSIKDIYKQLWNKVEQGTPREKASAISDMMTSPIFKISGNAEMFDRGANYMKQAEAIAKETNRTIEQVLKEAKKNNGNNKTYRAIMERVNNTLGDYIGRNYYVNQNINNALNMLAPFIRPYTQGARQFIAQAYMNPLGNQLFNRAPARYGYGMSQRGEELGVTPDEQYGGGFPILPAYGRLPSRVMVNPYHVYSAVGELASSPEDALSGNLMMIAPALGIAGRNRYNKEPLLPNQMVLNGRRIQLDNNGNEVKQTFLDNLRLAAAQSGQAYYAPINMMNATILPTLAALTGQEYRRPVDNALMGTIGNISLPFLMESDPTARARIGTENLLPQLGFTSIDTYPERELSTRDRKRGRKQIERRKQRNERR